MTLGPPSNHRSISGGLFLRYTYMYRPPLQTNRRCRSKGQEKEKAICYRQKLDRYRPACFFSPPNWPLHDSRCGARTRDTVFMAVLCKIDDDDEGRERYNVYITTWISAPDTRHPWSGILWCTISWFQKERKKTICILCLSFFTSVVE